MRHDKDCTACHRTGKCSEAMAEKAEMEWKITRANELDPDLPTLDPNRFKPRPVHLYSTPEQVERQLAAYKELDVAMERMKEEWSKASANLMKSLAETADMLTDVARRYGQRPTTAQLQEKVEAFKALHEGKFIEHGAYGPQSPDMIMEYIQLLTGEKWLFPEGYARQFMDTEDKLIHQHFHKLNRTQVGRIGDIVIADSSDQFGFIGIITHTQTYPEPTGRGRWFPGPALEIFTQSPIFPCGQLPIGWKLVVGGWRPEVKV